MATPGICSLASSVILPVPTCAPGPVKPRMGLPLRFPVFSPHRIHLYLPGENSNRKGAFSSHSAPWFYSQNFSPAVTCRAMPQALRSRPWVAAEIRKLGIGLGPGCRQGEPPGLLTPCAHTDAQPRQLGRQTLPAECPGRSHCSPSR